MCTFTYKEQHFAIDDQGCLLHASAWDQAFAEGMARECGIPVLLHEHWDVIHFVRDNFLQTGICPTIYATCKACSLLPREMQKLFPTGYHRGVCRIAGVHYRVPYMPYGEHVKESVLDRRALSDKVYRADIRGFLVDAEQWDEAYAHHRAVEMGIAEGLTEQHWQVIHYLRGMYAGEKRIPTIYETCEQCNVDLEQLEQLFPAGYHRGAVKIAGLRFVY